MITNKWESFVYELKWFMRAVSPIFVVYFFYLGMRKKTNND